MIAYNTNVEVVLMNKDKVTCAVCGNDFRIITESHLKKHGMTFAEYKLKYPNIETTPDEVREILSQHPFHKKISGANSPQWKGGMVDVICEICGKNIKVRPCEKYTRRFCSRKCMGIHQSKNCVGDNAYRWIKNKPTVFCMNCNKPFEVMPHTAKTRIFCSNKCAHEYFIGDKNPNYGNNYSDETRKIQSDIAKERFKNKSNHPRWNGGVSYEPYCTKFDEKFKESIRYKFNRICFICGISEKENGRRLDVHHVNYDKKCLCDDLKCEFVPLCISCHSKTNSKRTYWEKHIIDKLSKTGLILIE